MKKTFLMLFLIALITGCSDEIPEKVETGLLTQKYWSHQGLDYSGNDVYLIYTFSRSGNFDIEERDGSKDGKLIKSYYGKYQFTDDALLLEIFYSKECPDCSNKFTATLDEETGTFTYTIYDMVSKANKELKFTPF